MGSKNSALYYRQRRAQHRRERELIGVPLRSYADFAHNPVFVQRGNEMQAMILEPVPMLPWPLNLFADADNKVLQAQALQQQTPRNDALCICGKEHRQLYPRTVKSTYGHGFSVTYYCSNACKTRAAQQDSR
jgi:hypothetical protein